MTTNEYIFDQHQQDQELVRLRMIEELFDLTTIAHLERTGIREGWCCLEIGAGAGSIMKWMAGVVGEGGKVVAVDRNATHLNEGSSPQTQIIEGDLLEIDLDDTFDLAHCRYVLIHNRSGDEMLRRLCNAIKPGGFLVVEEPDFTSAKLLNRQIDDAQQRVNSAICRLFEDMGLNPGYGLTLPERVAAQGLKVVELDSRIHLARGGSGMAQMMAASTTALGDKYIATGEASQADIDQRLENARDEQFWTVYYSTISVVASKPPS